MKKSLFIIYFLITASAFGQDFTFRGHHWGASVEEVIAREGEPSYAFIDYLYYDSSHVGFPASLSFRFSAIPENGLDSAHYILYVSNDEAVNFYNDLLGRFSALYGKATRYQDEHYFHYWNVSRTEISIKMRQFNNIINIIIDYISPQSHLNIFRYF